MGSERVEDDLELNNNNGIKIQPFSSTPLHGNNKAVEQCKVPLSLAQVLGITELFSSELWRASVGEFLGMAVLVFMIDTIVISTIESKVQIPNLIFSILIGATFTVLILAVLPISGGHMNPMISFSAALVGLISLTRAAIYTLAQCLGAILGALVLKMVISPELQHSFSLTGCTINVVVAGSQGGNPVLAGIDTGTALLLECMCCFSLLFGAVWMAYDHRQAKELGLVRVFSIVGILLGLLVYLSSSVTGKMGYSGAGMNPARCFGPAVIRGGHLWNGHWVFWAGPGIASVIFYLYIKIIPSQHHKPKAYDHDFVHVINGLVGRNKEL